MYLKLNVDQQIPLLWAGHYQQHNQQLEK